MLSDHERDGYASQVASSILNACVDTDVIKTALAKEEFDSDDISAIEAVVRDLARGHKDSADYHRSFRPAQHL